MTKHILLSLGAALSLSGCAAAGADAFSGPPPAPEVITSALAGSSPDRGMVSAADPRAAEAGASILRQGGSATDAAIATMLALTVVEPQSSGIGGGGFYVRSSFDGQVETLDGREKAPAGADPDWFLNDDGQPVAFQQAVLSGLSIGVPGNIALAAEAHEKHGILPWSALFQPAITLARDGYVITPRFHNFLSFAKNRAASQPFGRALFYDAAGEPLPVGTRIRNPELASTLERIAAEGAKSFYHGERAAGLAATVADATPRLSPMTQADLEAYGAVWRRPVCGQYRVYRICGMGPPSSGATTVFAILKQLEGFDLAALGPGSATSWHLFAESQRLAYADREIYLADSDFVSVPVDGLIDADYLKARGALISADKRMPQVSYGTPEGSNTLLSDGDEPEENGTSHFVVVDNAGNAVSYTSTIEGAFGSGYTYGGFFLNNELTDFSFQPEVHQRPVANRVEGGKRPRSSMSPSIVFGPDGHVVMAIGAAGGSTIPVQVAKALIGVLDWGLPVDQAIALPGLFSPGDSISIEPGSSLLALKPQLEALGHTVIEREMPFKANGAQLIGGRWVGAADPRSEGVAIAQ